MTVSFAVACGLAILSTERVRLAIEWLLVSRSP
jgi:hypothetical protein